MIFSHHAIPPISKNKLYSVGKFKVFLIKYCGGQKTPYEAESEISVDLGHLKVMNLYLQLIWVAFKLD